MASLFFTEAMEIWKSSDNDRFPAKLIARNVDC